jgi:hypothetical protein
MATDAASAAPEPSPQQGPAQVLMIGGALPGAGRGQKRKTAGEHQRRKQPPLASQGHPPPPVQPVRPTQPYYQGAPSISPVFSMKGRIIILTGEINLEAWVQQTTAIARATNSYAELTTDFAGFPQQGSVEAWICNARYSTAWRLLVETISGPVWAYM